MARTAGSLSANRIVVVPVSGADSAAGIDRDRS